MSEAAPVQAAPVQTAPEQTAPAQTTPDQTAPAQQEPAPTGPAVPLQGQGAQTPPQQEGTVSPTKTSYHFTASEVDDVNQTGETSSATQGQASASIPPDVKAAAAALKQAQKDYDEAVRAQQEAAKELSTSLIQAAKDATPEAVEQVLNAEQQDNSEAEKPADTNAEKKALTTESLSSLTEAAERSSTLRQKSETDLDSLIAQLTALENDGGDLRTLNMDALLGDYGSMDELDDDLTDEDFGNALDALSGNRVKTPTLIMSRTRS